MVTGPYELAETGRRRLNGANHYRNRGDIGESASAEMLEKTGS
jgi:hypothetical protein